MIGVCEIIDYGVALTGATRIPFGLTKAGTANEATGSDWSPAAGEVKIAKDLGAEANIATLPTYSNGSWLLALSAAEAQAKRVVVSVRAAAVNFAKLILQTDKNAAARWITDFAKGDWAMPSDLNSFVQSLAAAAPFNVSTPAAPQHLDLFKADSYKSAQGSGRTLPFAFAAGEPWPDTISTADFYCRPTQATLDANPSAVGLGPIACVIDVATGAGRHVTLNLAKTDTQLLTPGVDAYTFAILANRATEPAVIRFGTLTARPDPTA